MIYIDDISTAILDSMEWGFKNAQSMNLSADDYANDTMQNYAHAAIDSAMVYTSDIMETWEHYGRPECEDGMSDGTIMGAITWAVYESLRGDVDTWAILETWIKSHETLLPANIASDDVGEAFEFLEEYARTEH